MSSSESLRVSALELCIQVIASNKTACDACHLVSAVPEARNLYSIGELILEYNSADLKFSVVNAIIRNLSDEGESVTELADLLNLARESRTLVTLDRILKVFEVIPSSRFQEID